MGHNGVGVGSGEGRADTLAVPARDSNLVDELHSPPLPQICPQPRSQLLAGGQALAALSDLTRVSTGAGLRGAAGGIAAKLEMV